MPDGHIRGVQTHRRDLATASEWCIYPSCGIAPTIKTTGGEHLKLLITDERFQRSIYNALLR